MKVYAKVFFVVIVVSIINYLLILHPVASVGTDSLEIFFSLFGMIYAIIVGFSILVVLNNYNEIRLHMNAEINELQDLRDYLMYVDNQNEVRDEIAKNIREYAVFIVEKEWPAISHYQEVDFDTPPAIYEIMKSVNKIQPTNQSDIVALERLITTIAEITTARTNRLTASVDRLPALLRHLIVILSAVIIFSFTMIPIKEIWLNILLNAVNSFGIALIYFVIMDLDYPFGGVWSIQPEPFQAFLKRWDIQKKNI